MPIMEGYGLTETSPVISFNNFDALRFGSVGKPLPDADVKIGDEGEMRVQPNDPVAVRPPHAQDDAKVLQVRWLDITPRL